MEVTFLTHGVAFLIISCRRGVCLNLTSQYHFCNRTLVIMSIPHDTHCHLMLSEGCFLLLKLMEHVGHQICLSVHWISGHKLHNKDDDNKLWELDTGVVLIRCHILQVAVNIVVIQVHQWYIYQPVQWLLCKSDQTLLLTECVHNKP